MSDTADFINTCKNYKCLYDMNDPDYRDGNKKAQVWEEIAAQFGLATGDLARQKWKNLRDCYVKYKRALKGNTTVPRSYRNWPHKNRMSFLQPYMISTKGLANCTNFNDYIKVVKQEEDPLSAGVKRETFDGEFEDEEEDEEYGEVDELPAPTVHLVEEDNISTSSSTAKRKKNRDTSQTKKKTEKTLKLYEENFDSTDLFFLSLSKMVKTMQKKKQAEVKLKCSQFVMEAEMEIDDDSS